MFLQNYSGFSDRKLIEQLNWNLDWQFFCDIYLGADRLENFKMISEIRCELTKKLDIDKVQKAFYGYWSPHMADKGSITMDATKYGIRTDFKRKGRAGKQEKQRSELAGTITKERASRLEGSFGKDKEHYHLKRIRARTKATEILWIFFGIHTGNALEVGRRMAVSTPPSTYCHLDFLSLALP